MMPPDVISHENQLQHLSEPSIFILDVFRTVTTPDRFSYHTGLALISMMGIYEHNR